MTLHEKITTLHTTLCICKTKKKIFKVNSNLSMGYSIKLHVKQWISVLLAITEFWENPEINSFFRSFYYVKLLLHNKHIQLTTHNVVFWRPFRYIFFCLRYEDLLQIDNKKYNENPTTYLYTHYRKDWDNRQLISVISVH